MNEGHLEFCASEDWRRLLHDMILPTALAGVDLGSEVLEIGPGPGFTTDVLKDRTQSLTAVEIDQALADALMARLAGTNVLVLVGDATALEFPDAHFSGAASFNMLHHIPTVHAQQQALREVARVLQPGGVLIATDSGYSAGTHLFHEGDTYNPIEGEAVEKRLLAAGFASVEVRTYDLGWAATARAA
ncbi:MAG TPA: class I SAM-dependent methyltransferase [Acidimicrobiales bacterium]|jgi:SAM-dependent methyltransferase